MADVGARHAFDRRGYGSEGVCGAGESEALDPPLKRKAVYRLGDCLLGRLPVMHTHRGGGKRGRSSVCLRPW